MGLKQGGKEAGEAPIFSKSNFIRRENIKYYLGVKKNRFFYTQK